MIGASSRRGLRAGIGVLAGAGLLALASPAGAQAFQQHGLNFVTVGDPGNRGATAAEAPLWPTWAPPLGAVDHTFGIMRTNVTNTQWVEFVREYAPYYPGQPFETGLTGLGISYTGTIGGRPQYEISPGAENFTAQMSWRVAARFANWLHNDKSLDPTAFENGAYDTSTFGVDPQGRLTDQFTHNPGARFWIPSIHEYTKAAHWDPDKFGPGQGGYWLMPDGGDEQLMAGPPGVGECAGDWIGAPFNIDVESYPATLSPWGLMDVSSTVKQFTEGRVHPSVGLTRLVRGSNAGSLFYGSADRIDNAAAIDPDLYLGAIRIATIPAPASVAPLLVLLISNRRTRT